MSRLAQIHQDLNSKPSFSNFLDQFLHFKQLEEIIFWQKIQEGYRAKEGYYSLPSESQRGEHTLTLKEESCNPTTLHRAFVPQKS